MNLQEAAKLHLSSYKKDILNILENGIFPTNGKRYSRPLFFLIFRRLNDNNDDAVRIIFAFFLLHRSLLGSQHQVSFQSLDAFSWDYSISHIPKYYFEYASQKLRLK